MAHTYIKRRLTDVLFVAMFSVAIAACAWISIPCVVPFTLQSFGVFLALCCLGGKRGSVCVFLYLLLGAVGMPVFSGGGGGIGILLGANGGYLFGFLLAALFMWLCEALFGKGTLILLTSMIIGLIVCYTTSIIWFMLYTQSTHAVGLWTALLRCVFPFVIPDLMKIALAFSVSKRISKFLSGKYKP